MLSEHRKQKAIRQLQSLEQKARSLQRLLENDSLGEQMQMVAELREHLSAIIAVLTQEAIENFLLRSTRTEEVKELANELTNCLKILGSI